MYELSEDHELFRKVVRDFAEQEIAPRVAQWDREHHFPVDVVHKMGELGLLGLGVPEQYGGSGGDFTSVCVAIEEIGRVDQSLGVTLEAGMGLGINPILTFGTEFGLQAGLAHRRFRPAAKSWRSNSTSSVTSLFCALVERLRANGSMSIAVPNMYSSPFGPTSSVPQNGECGNPMAVIQFVPPFVERVNI